MSASLIAFKSTAHFTGLVCLNVILSHGQIETEEDELWKPDSRETHDQIRARGAAFIKWLLARPERCLAVVSHSSFLFYLMQNFGHQVSTTVQGELRRW